MTADIGTANSGGGANGAVAESEAEHLIVSGLIAGYDGRAIIHDLDLSIARGEVACLLGPNGAGKSTTLGALTGLVDTMGGSVQLAGRELLTLSTARIARAGVAHVPEDRSLFPSLTVKEHLRLAAPRSRGRSDVSGVDQVVEWFPSLKPLMGKACGLLSGGEQQMVAIARGLMGRPSVLLIDEMSLGLAPLVVGALLDSIVELADTTRCAVLLVEQHVSLALSVSARAYVLSRGRITYHGSASDLADNNELLLQSYL